MKYFLIILFSFILAKGSATNYHFSNSGNDNNAGTIAAPIKSLSKINSLALQSGDTVSFNRGETFYGAFRITNVSNITFVPYGTGSNPVISGFAALTVWTSSGNGVYKTKCDSCDAKVRMVSVDGESKTKGRWPNSGYRHNAPFTVNTTTWFRDETLHTDNAIDWTGASVVNRKKNWIIDIDSVTKNVGDTIFYQNLEGSTYKSYYYYGWFIIDDLRAVDSMHEWFYNRNTQDVSMFFGANSPSSYQVKAASIDTLVKVEFANDISFRNITFEGSNETAVLLRAVHRITFDSCSVLCSGRNGLFGRSIPGATDNSSYITVTNSTFNNTNNNAIELQSKFHHNTIINNTITNTSILAGMGMSDDNAGQGIVVTGDNGLITKNVIRNTGYLPINWGGDSSKVTKNLLDSGLLNKSDGGGIYTFTGSLQNYKNRREISDNIILNMLGEKQSTDLIFRGYEANELAMGIYLDIVTDNVIIKNNTIANCAQSGIYLLVNRNIRIENNNFYNNGNQIMFQGTFVDSLKNAVAVNNRMVLGASSIQRIFNSEGGMNDVYHQYNKLDSNYFAVPFGQTTLYKTTGITLDSFRVVSGFDVHSVKATQTSTNVLFKYNYSDNVMPVWLDGTWYDAAGKAFSNTVYIEPYGSLVLMKINSQVRLKGVKIRITR